MTHKYISFTPTDSKLVHSGNRVTLKRHKFYVSKWNKFSNCNEEENTISPNCQMRHGARNLKNRKRDCMNARERMLSRDSKTPHGK